MTGVQTCALPILEDPLLYLYSANTYPYNFDIGFYSHFSTTGPQPGNGYQHTGLVRDFNDNVWKFFSNVAEPTLGVVTFDANTIYDAVKMGAITSLGAVSATGNVTGANLVTAGVISATGNANVGNLGTTGVFATTLSSTGNANVRSEEHHV